MADRSGDNQWLQHLSDEDRTFIKRFVLASGSLKEMAKVYGVSYPTVRLRLDRLIQKIKVVDDHTAAGPFERQVRALFAEGRIDQDTMRTLLDTHRTELEQATPTDRTNQFESRHQTESRQSPASNATPAQGESP